MVTCLKLRAAKRTGTNLKAKWGSCSKHDPLEKPLPICNDVFKPTFRGVSHKWKGENM